MLFLYSVFCFVFFSHCTMFLEITYMPVCIEAPFSEGCTGLHCICSAGSLQIDVQVCGVSYCCCNKFYQTLSDIKRQKQIILQFCRSKAPNGSCWAKIRMLAGLPSLWRRLEGESVSLLFLTSRDHLHSLACVPFLRIQTQQPQVECFLNHTSSFSFSALLLSLLRTLVITLSQSGESPLF